MCHLKEVDLYLRWRWRCACVCCGVGCVCVSVSGVLWCCRRCGVACCCLMRCLLHLDQSHQTWRHHLATFERVMVTPAVCPRLFEFLTTLTFGALRRNHMVSTPFETVAKKKSKRRDTEGSFVRVQSAINHYLSRIQPKLERKCVSVGVVAVAAVSRRKKEMLRQ